MSLPDSEAQPGVRQELPVLLQLLLGVTSDSTVLCTGEAFFKNFGPKSVYRAENGQF